MSSAMVARHGGVHLHVEVDGEGPGAPVLLTHGFGASSAMWSGNVPALSRGRRVVAWDLRGHGRTTTPLDPGLFSVELCVADMAAVLDAQGIDRAVMIGMSLGGFLSLRFAIEHPERVAALVLVDTGPGYKNEEARARWNRYADRMADALETEGHAGLRESPEADRTADPRGLVLAARLIMTQRDDLVITSLPTIGVPTLVIVGELDAPFLDGSRYMAERIPYARLEIIPGAGHAANIDRADLVNDLVADFLHEVDASSR